MQGAPTSLYFAFEGVKQVLPKTTQTHHTFCTLKLCTRSTPRHYRMNKVQGRWTSFLQHQC